MVWGDAPHKDIGVQRKSTQEKKKGGGVTDGVRETVKVADSVHLKGDLKCSPHKNRKKRWGK